MLGYTEWENVFDNYYKVSSAFICTIQNSSKNIHTLLTNQKGGFLAVGSHMTYLRDIIQVRIDPVHMLCCVINGQSIGPAHSLVM